MKIVVDLQIADTTTDSGVKIGEDEVAELVETAVSNFGAFNTVDDDGDSRRCHFVNVEASPWKEEGDDDY